MEEALLVLLGTAGTLIVGLLGVVVTQRRDGKNGGHNPNFETLQVLIRQQIDLQEKSLDKLDTLIVSMTGIETTVQFCPTVQARK